MSKAFRTELESLINRHSMENGSDTPDYILADYLRSSLQAFDTATIARDRWYGGGGNLSDRGRNEVEQPGLNPAPTPREEPVQLEEIEPAPHDLAIPVCQGLPGGDLKLYVDGSEIGEIHGDDQCSNPHSCSNTSVIPPGQPHHWALTHSLPKPVGDTSPEHPAEAMNLGFWAQCLHCHVWAELKP